MCALVQHFLCPLSSNIISGVLKSFNSEDLQREQLAVNSEELQQQWYTKSRVLFVGKVNYNDVSECSILPFEDAIPRASPMLLWTTLPLPLIYILPLSQVSGFSQWWFDGGSFLKSSFGWALLQMIRLPFGDVQSCFAQPRITGVHLWSLPVFYIAILTFFRAIPTRLPSFVSSLPLSFMCI
jgi:hypothetical protein